MAKAPYPRRRDMITTKHPARSTGKRSRAAAQAGPMTLTIDIGGTGLKAGLISPGGELIGERVRVETPVGAEPRKIVALLAALVEPVGPYDRVSVGFPGVVRGGVIRTAANLGNEEWIGYDLASALSKTLKKAVRVMNDADLQGLGAISGMGMEMVITLGTGFGSGIYHDGHVGPHLELAHHPFRQGETYEEQLSNKARKKIGVHKWNRRVLKAIHTLRALTHFDILYIGGGNVKYIDFKPPEGVILISNVAGLTGGVALWRDNVWRNGSDQAFRRPL